MIDLKYRKHVMNFIGRNGVFKQSGIMVQPWFAAKAVVLQPITSRGMTGNCQMEIPNEDIPDFIDALKKTYNEMNPTIPLT